jgi:2-polyprenyl-3-methyl-5-hydroxy-6-metoxy-1,4-benzoquinol methylase
MKKLNYEIFECQECRSIFVNPNQVHADNNKQYENNISSSLAFCMSSMEPDTLTFIERITSLRQQYRFKSIIDIGCSIGLFLKIARDMGYQVLGIEPNPITARFGMDTYGLNIINSYFDNAFTARNSIKADLVYSSDVIEHMIDPIEFLVNSKKLIDKNGILVTITPDFDNIETKIVQIRPPKHLFYFNYNNVRYLYNKAGLRIIEIGKVHRKRTVQPVLHSSFFMNGSHPILMHLIKGILALRFDRIIEPILEVFKEDLLIISKAQT